jgi:uncharacterized SAM-binding protein YcdF (DUF218 family)
MDAEFLEIYNLLLKNRPEKSEAVVWLQGDRYDRAEKVLEIYKNKLADKIVISGNDILIGPGPRPGEDNIGLAEMNDYLLENGVRGDDIIIDDEALNTPGQAVHIIDLAKQRKWKKIILVSSAYHQPRVLLTFLKQLKLMDEKIDIYNQPVEMELNKVPGGRKETVKELCLGEIIKINKYTNDVLPIKFGINYLKLR